jgi:hypothetical protein
MVSCAAAEDASDSSVAEGTTHADDADASGTVANGTHADTGPEASTGSTSLESTVTTNGDVSAGGVTTADESSGGLPEGPSCSVQVVTHGELFDPVAKGEGRGLIPTVVGDALEDYCGCHTLMSNAQNVEHPFLRAPAGTLFLDRQDFFKSYKGSTLGAVSETEIRGFRMPPGNCPFPDAAETLLLKWFEDGMPDGATFDPG